MIIARILHEYELPPMNYVIHDKEIIENCPDERTIRLLQQYTTSDVFQVND
jgi:hypothetical protein